MSRVRTLAILGALALAACSEAPISPSAAVVRGPSGNASLATDASGTYLVAFKGGIPSDFASHVASLGGTVMWAHAGVGLAAVGGLSTSAATAIAGRSDVGAVEADDYTVLERPDANNTLSAGSSEIESVANPAGAFFFPRQWNMRAIQANTAWAAGNLGKATTRVGIIDTGIDYTHADLAGLVDLGASVSLLPSEDALVQTLFPGAHPIADLYFHGTHVAATVSSKAVAAAGVTSKVTLVGIKVCNSSGSCPTSAVLGGILYAADAGLDVANMSLGGAFQRRDASGAGGSGPSFIAIINKVFNYAYAKGTLMVVSAGNAAEDMSHNKNTFDAYCDAPHVVCVSATGPTAQAGTNGPWTNVDALAYYSNFGNSIALGAPGGNNATAVWAACSHFSQVLPVCATGTFIVGAQGTSMAAPHVTGVAALIAGSVGHNPQAIQNALENSADDIGKPGNDPVYGKGRVNAAHAVGL